MPFFSHAEVKRAAQGRWRDVLARCGVAAELLDGRHGPCPGCGGRDRFRFDDKDGNGTFLCSRGGGGTLAGNGFALLEHIHGWDWKKATDTVGGLLGVQPTVGERKEPPPPETAPVPRDARKRAETVALDQAAVERFIAGTPTVDAGWFRRRSPMDVWGMTSGQFLDALYEKGERVIIFDEYYSQGNFLWQVGSDMSGPKAGGYRLSDQRGVNAVPSELPRTGRMGVWYLVQPVSGKWEIAPGAKEGVAKFTRRSEVNVTRWAFFVLESDELAAEDWMRVVASLRLPVAAIYTSGGRSIHALLKYEVGSKAMWDELKKQLERVVCPLGADPGALSAVRLSRLPGCFREGAEMMEERAEKKWKRYVKYESPRLQELLYINPRPGFVSIAAMQEVRG